MKKEKMMLLVDKVNSCSECELCVTKYDEDGDKELHCAMNENYGWLPNYDNQVLDDCPLQDTTELLIAVCRLHSRAEQLFKHRPQDNTFDNEEQNDVLRDKLYKALGLNNGNI